MESGEDDTWSISHIFLEYPYLKHGIYHMIIRPVKCNLGAGLRIRKDIWDVWTLVLLDEMTPALKVQSLTCRVILPTRTGGPNVLPDAEAGLVFRGAGRPASAHFGILHI